MSHELPLTIFTPTYNRAHTLPRVYESLKSQSCKDFLWLIIDDGSADNTPELIRQWQEQEISFPIRCIRKENGGMHTAHNAAYDHITTELNLCLDSDDALAPDAVEKILTKWESVRHLGYAGIIGLDADFSGAIIGSGFPEGLQETTVIGYYASGGRGDKKLIYRTDVIRQFPPYPVFPGEKYVSLSYKYRLIDQHYKMAVLDEVLCRVDYQQDGSSNTMWQQYWKNPKGFAFWRRVCMEYPYSKTRMLKDCIHYISSSILGKDRFFISKSPRKLLTVLCLPAGWVLSVLTRVKARG